MAPNSIGAFLFKHQREKVKDPQAMITILIVLHGAQTWWLLTPQPKIKSIFEHLSKVSKKRDTQN